MKIIVFIIYCGLFVGIGILLLSSCRTQCTYSYSRWLRENSNPINHVEKNVFINGEQYIITEDTVLKTTIEIERVDHY